MTTPLPAPIRVGSFSTTAATGTVFTVTVANPTPAGATLLVAGIVNQTLLPINSITDSAGNVYSLVDQITGAAPSIYYWRANGPDGGPGGGPTAPLTAGMTLTFTWNSAGGTKHMWCIAIPDSQMDAVGSPVAVGTANSVTASATTASPGGTAVVLGVASGGAVLTEPAGWTAITPRPDGVGGPVAWAAWAPFSAAGTVTATATTTANTSHRALMMLVAAPPPAGAYPLKVWDGTQWRDVSAGGARAYDGSQWLPLN